MKASRWSCSTRRPPGSGKGLPILQQRNCLFRFSVRENWSIAHPALKRSKHTAANRFIPFGMRSNGLKIHIVIMSIYLKSSGTLSTGCWKNMRNVPESRKKPRPVSAAAFLQQVSFRKLYVTLQINEYAVTLAAVQLWHRNAAHQIPQVQFHLTA